MDGLFFLCTLFLISLLSTFFLTIPVRKLSFFIGALDMPERRKIHHKVTPRLGGLAIFLGALLGFLYWYPQQQILWKIGIGGFIVLCTGFLDDKYELSPFAKLTGQMIATIFVILSGLTIDRLTLPFFGVLELDFLGIPITMLWLIGITNAINLIDGLDGLATGVTMIALASIFTMALLHGQMAIAYLCILLIGACGGFLYHNFHPAKIYMGDSGSNFLGFMIASISIVGLFKNVTLFSFVFPIIILAVPIFDTFLVIFRRFTKAESIVMADRKHIHYRLLGLGYSHRQAVFILYGFSALFGLQAILLASANFFLSLILALIIVFLLFMLAEVTGLMKDDEIQENKKT